MASRAPEPSRIRFDAFELDATSGELRKDGILLKLQPQPFRVLLLLIERSGQVVTREEIQRYLWTDSTFVDFEHGINFSINQIRGALSDSAEKPRYIETLPRRGYRFIGTVVTGGAKAPEPREVGVSSATAIAKVPDTTPRRQRLSKAVDSLAVLPFTNLSGDPEVEYLSDGITETLINNFSQLRKIRIVPRDVVFRYKGSQVSAEALGAELKVRAILTGRVMQRGDTLIVGAELLDVAKMAQLWGAQYKRKLADLLMIQEEIASEIAEKLRLHLPGEPKKQFTSQLTADNEAYKLYLKALYFQNRWTAEDLQKSINYSKQAIEHDPAFASAHIALASSYCILAMAGMQPPSDVFPKAREAALRALQINEGLAEAHAALAAVYLIFDWDWAAAEREIERAMQLNPDDRLTHSVYFFFLLSGGRLEQAIASARRAVELAPLSLPNNSLLGASLFFARHYDQVIEQQQKTVELDPNYVRARETLVFAYAHAGRSDSAIAECAVIASLPPPGKLVSRMAHAYVYALLGKSEEARKIMEEVRSGNEDNLPLLWRASHIYAILNERDQAFELLNRLCDARFGLVVFFKAYPSFDNLRADPRYRVLSRRIGFPE